MGQLVESQTQRPAALHSWPSAQAAVGPHRQVPVAEQLSARSGGQARQLFPPVPQVAALGEVWQLLPLQHPAHVDVVQPLQLPPVQVSVAAQVAHAAPLLPHSCGD